MHYLHKYICIDMHYSITSTNLCGSIQTRCWQYFFTLKDNIFKIYNLACNLIVFFFYVQFKPLDIF